MIEFFCQNVMTLPWGPFRVGKAPEHRLYLGTRGTETMTASDFSAGLSLITN